MLVSLVLCVWDVSRAEVLDGLYVGLNSCGPFSLSFVIVCMQWAKALYAVYVLRNTDSLRQVY